MSGWRTAIVQQVSHSTSASQPPASPQAVWARASAIPVRSPGSSVAARSAAARSAAARWSAVGERSRSMSRTVRPSSRQPTSCRMTRSRPSTWTLPAWAGWSPAMTRNRVVLPAPLAPTRATWSPSPTRKLTSLSRSTPAGVRQATPFTSIAPTARTLPMPPTGRSEDSPTASVCAQHRHAVLGAHRSA